MNITISEKAVLYRINKFNQNDNQISIGAYIRKERMAQGLKQESVCKDICSVSYYSRIESNKVIPTNEFVTKIFNKLDKSIPSNLACVENVEIKESINHFLTAIEYKNDQLVEKEYEKIKDLSNIYAELYQFIYLIYFQKIDQVDSLITKLHSLQVYFVNDELLLYLENLGTYYMIKINHKKAESILNLALQLAEKFNQIRPLVLYKYAWVQGKLNNDLKCIEFAEEAKKHFTKNHNTYRSIQCQMLIAIKMSKWFPAKAIQIYEKINLISEQYNLNTFLKTSRFNLSLLLKKCDYLEEAESSFIEIINAYSNDSMLLMNIYIEYIDLLLSLSKINEAKIYFEKMRQLNIKSKNFDFFIKYYDYKLTSLDIPLKLNTYKKEFIPYSQATNNLHLEIKIRKEYAVLLEKSKNYEDCISEYKIIMLLEHKKNYTSKKGG